jgi:hypothetical protein
VFIKSYLVTELELLNNTTVYIYSNKYSPAMGSPNYSNSSSDIGKLIVLQESRNDYNDIVEYKWVNKPGLPISVRQFQSETPILHADTSLLKYLTELLQSDPLTSWSVTHTFFFQERVLNLFRAVHLIGDSNEAKFIGIKAGCREYEFSVILIPESNGK